MRNKPISCDTFAVLPPGSGCVVFGKNSDRPAAEVQEIVYETAMEHAVNSKVKCTYIEVEQVPHTFATVLSKPAWMWGAEMGANEHGVCIGNEAVWTKVNDSPDSTERLLGMDLLRLALERAHTAPKALSVITELLETYGQGGNCSDILHDFTYHNSFLIADPTEVWILETAKKLWAAERVTSGFRNISNDLSIGTKIDLMSSGLDERAREKGLWDPSSGPFNFKKAFGFCDDDEDEDFRYKNGKRLLSTLSKSGNFKETDMFKVLRDEKSGICMSGGSFITTGSQVSLLRSRASEEPSVHWFTGTPVPTRSVFKPFIFAQDVQFPVEVVSPVPAHSYSDRAHTLYKLHEKYVKPSLDAKKRNGMMQLESHLQNKVARSDASNAGSLFKDSVLEELRLYS